MLTSRGGFSVKLSGAKIDHASPEEVSMIVGSSSQTAKSVYPDGLSAQSVLLAVLLARALEQSFPREELAVRRMR
jgi:hypothetical protein